MRVLHTSDWHLGRVFHGVPLLEHQRAVIEAMVQAVRDQRVDVVVVAGDVYDRAIPSVEAVQTLDWALAELHATGARIVGIAGNHDSAARIGFAEPLLATVGVSLRGDAHRVGVPVVVPASDGGPDVAFHLIPFLEPEVARHALGVPDARTHDAVLGVALDLARADLSAREPCRSVAVAHAAVRGGTTSDSERPLSIGGADQVPSSLFDGFDYVALGHLHRRQGFGERIRYSGSPLAFSFSESDDTKSAWLVDLAPDGTVAVDAIDLPVPRRLARLRGEVDHLLADASLTWAEPCWVQITMTDAVPPADPMSRLQVRFPHLVSLVPEPPAGRDGDITTYTERVRGRSDLELAFDFVKHVTGRAPGPGDRAELQDVMEAVRAAEAAR